LLAWAVLASLSEPARQILNDTGKPAPFFLQVTIRALSVQPSRADVRDDDDGSAGSLGLAVFRGPQAGAEQLLADGVTLLAWRQP
jgi:hypothetical protein